MAEKKSDDNDTNASMDTTTTELPYDKPSRAEPAAPLSFPIVESADFCKACHYDPNSSIVRQVQWQNAADGMNSFTKVLIHGLEYCIRSDSFEAPQAPFDVFARVPETKERPVQELRWVSTDRFSVTCSDIQQLGELFRALYAAGAVFRSDSTQHYQLLHFASCSSNCTGNAKLSGVPHLYETKHNMITSTEQRKAAGEGIERHKASKAKRWLCIVEGSSK